MLGFVVCTEYKFTNPKSLHAAPFPLNGPHMFKLSLEVARNFLFLVEFNDDDKLEPYIYMLFDTPGTNEKRKSSLKFNAAFKDEHMMVGVALVSPLTTLAAMAGFRNNEKELKLYANLKMPNDDQKLEVGFMKSGNAQVRSSFYLLLQFNLTFDFICTETRIHSCCSTQHLRS